SKTHGVLRHGNNILRTDQVDECLCLLADHFAVGVERAEVPIGRRTNERLVTHDDRCHRFPSAPPGSRSGLRHSRPPRTVRETFASYDSSLGQRPCEIRPSAAPPPDDTSSTRRACLLGLEVSLDVTGAVPATEMTSVAAVAPAYEHYTRAIV